LEQVKPAADNISRVRGIDGDVVNVALKTPCTEARKILFSLLLFLFVPG
jgi:hypothetical protein